jgi:hypothetical protein
MATAMAFPIGLPRGRGKCSQIREHLSKTQENYISQARYVLRNNPPASNSEYPQYRILDADPTAYVLSANVHRRHLTKGQQAMAVALAYPEAEKGGRGRKLNSSKNEEFSVASGYISQARFVLRHCL